MTPLPTLEDKPDCCVLLFVKFPEKEKVKHRLAVALTEEIAVELYRNFVLDTLSMLEELSLPFFVCFYPPEDQKKFIAWLGTQYPFLPQEGTDFGRRMRGCFEKAFVLGFHRVVLIGSDSPDLPSGYLKGALSALQKQDAVLGPAVDGGYYLIGFRKETFTPSVFDNIPWSTPSVLAKTMTILKKANRSIHVLPPWSDVDTIDDLDLLISRSDNTAFKSSRTISYIRQRHILEEDNHGG